jgi:hypothetical protein
MPSFDGNSGAYRKSSNLEKSAINAINQMRCLIRHQKQFRIDCSLENLVVEVIKDEEDSGEALNYLLDIFETLPLFHHVYNPAVRETEIGQETFPILVLHINPLQVPVGNKIKINNILPHYLNGDVSTDGLTLRNLFIIQINTNYYGPVIIEQKASRSRKQT